MAVKSKNRTHRTDANGSVKAEHQAAFELQWLKTARRYGVPEKFLEPGGWNGDEGDLTGFWSEAVYMLGDALAALDTTPERCDRAIWMCSVICDRYSISRDAIPYEAREFLKRFAASRKRREIAEGGELPLADPEDVGLEVLAEWGLDCRCGGAHGLASGVWRCL